MQCKQDDTTTKLIKIVVYQREFVDKAPRHQVDWFVVVVAVEVAVAVAVAITVH